MNNIKPDELEKACKAEKNQAVRARIVAVRMVLFLGMSVTQTAEATVHCPTWVRKWLRRFDDGGLEGLRDLPRCGRSRKIPRKVLDEIIAEVVNSPFTPVELQQYIKMKTGVNFHITYIRKIMCQYNLTPKVAQQIHINRADRKAVYNWRYRLKQQISRLEKKGFVIVPEDEAFFIHDVKSGRKYWSPKGQRIHRAYTGSHKKITVYGSITSDGRQLFRTYEGSNSETFVAYLKELQRRFGKVLVIADRASSHKSDLVREFLRDNENIKITYFPKGSPYLNPVEECWRQGKHALSVSEYYRTFLDMCQALYVLSDKTVPFGSDQICKLN